MSHISTHNQFLRYRPWFYAAALYNLVWGSINVLLPTFLFDLIDMPHPNNLALWQVVGMFVLVYAPAYWWVARHPERHPHLVLIGLLGKVLGPVGFIWSVIMGHLPLAFGWIILTNDLIWWPVFGAYLKDAAPTSEAWKKLVQGE
jgi:small multidrug resistance pump